MKQNAKKGLARSLPFFLSFAIICPLLSYALVSYIHHPRNEETITVFIGCCDSKAKKAKSLLEENKPSYLLEIQFYCYSYLESSFSTYFTAIGRENADLVILPESQINDDTILLHYLPLETKSDPSDYISKKNGKHYGVLLRKEKEASAILPYADETHDENYYAFYAKGSLHAGELTSSAYDTSSLFISLLKEANQ